MPLKQTGEVDLSRPLLTLLGSGRSVSADDRASVAELQALRNKMVAAIKNKAHTDAELTDMMNYFDQLGRRKGGNLHIWLNQTNVQEISRPKFLSVV